MFILGGFRKHDSVWWCYQCVVCRGVVDIFSSMYFICISQDQCKKSMDYLSMLTCRQVLWEHHPSSFLCVIPCPCCFFLQHQLKMFFPRNWPGAKKWQNFRNAMQFLANVWMRNYQNTQLLCGGQFLILFMLAKHCNICSFRILLALFSHT